MVDLTKEEVDFLVDLAHELETQDNRGTSSPYYYTVRKTKKFIGTDANYGSDTVYVDMVSGDYVSYPTYSEAVKSVIKDGICETEKDAERYVDDNFQEFGTFEYPEDRNVFLTYKGYLRHVKLNGHNYSPGINGDTYTEDDDKKEVGGVYSYLQHADRNPEMAKLIELVKKLGNQLKGQSK